MKAPSRIRCPLRRAAAGNVRPDKPVINDGVLERQASSSSLDDRALEVGIEIAYIDRIESLRIERSVVVKANTDILCHQDACEAKGARGCYASKARHEKLPEKTFLFERSVCDRKRKLQDTVHVSIHSVRDRYT